MLHLTRVAIRPPERSGRDFPFDLPALRSVTELTFDADVTIFVGENGSGKSTLLEALAIASRSITAGSAEAADDSTLAGVRALAASLRLSWAKRTHRGFFLRAEDFFGFARRMATLRTDLERGLAEVDAEYADRPELARVAGAVPVPQGARRVARAVRRRDRHAIAWRELPGVLPGAPGAGWDLLPRRARGAALARPSAGVPLAARQVVALDAARWSWRPTRRSCWRSPARRSGRSTSRRSDRSPTRTWSTSDSPADFLQTNPDAYLRHL